MEVQQQLSLCFWDQDSTSSSLNIGLKHEHLIRSLPSKFTESTEPVLTSLQLKTFVKHSNNNTKSSSKTLDISQVEVQSGGTRWNPTQEQIRALEALYKGGMRTPNANQIERITIELGKYGRMEGKNVFYWFQNHKARERQKQKRSALLSLSNSSTVSHPPPLMSLFIESRGEEEEDRKEWCDGNKKRRCRSWSEELEVDEDEGDGTLELFPLHPELGR